MEKFTKDKKFYMLKKEICIFSLRIEIKEMIVESILHARKVTHKESAF